MGDSEADKAMYGPTDDQSDRLKLIAMVVDMIASYHTADEIVDAVIAELAPKDGEECPVCGICP